MRRWWWLLVVWLAVLFCAPLLALPRPQEEPTPTPTATAAPTVTTAAPYRAVWVSYLEWQQVDFSTAETFTADIEEMLDNIQSLGATVVLAQVRPFGDALYPSRYYPFSHLCTGTQGQDPGYDPLALLTEQAHARGLEVEAWINPYRIQSGSVPALCETSPAKLHPEWVKYTSDGAYLDPANAQVRQYIADAVEELCSGYAIDGIHFDDYFYPTSEPEFDAKEYAAAGTTLPRDDWRRANVNDLMERCHAAARRYGVRFGTAPVGDPEQSRTVLYGDAAAWLREGTVDYLMPQLYWGQQYTRGGDSSHSFEKLAAQWMALPRAAGVQLYVGLGAYRIGAGDGSDTPGEWTSGHALADQLTVLKKLGITGAGLYRYGSLFANDEAPQLAADEAAAIRALWE